MTSDREQSCNPAETLIQVWKMTPRLKVPFVEVAISFQFSSSESLFNVHVCGQSNYIYAELVLPL